METFDIFSSGSSGGTISLDITCLESTVGSTLACEVQGSGFDSLQMTSRVLGRQALLTRAVRWEGR